MVVEGDDGVGPFGGAFEKRVESIGLPDVGVKKDAMFDNGAVRSERANCLRPFVRDIKRAALLFQARESDRVEGERDARSGGAPVEVAEREIEG